jgi:hypothetical protein
MPTITNFNGSWNPTTFVVTLEWILDSVVGIAEVKVWAGGKAVFKGEGNGRFTLAGKDQGSGSFTLEVKDGSGPAATKASINLVYERSLEDPPFVNAGSDWLTYETVLNKQKFRKTNQLRRVGLYAADMADLQLWIRSDMPPASFGALCAAFFPDHTPSEIQRLSDASWWWKQDEQRQDFESLKAMQAPYFAGGRPQPPAQDAPAWLPQSGADIVASRAVLQLHLPRYAVLPYNFWDNDPESRSIGTAGSDQLHPIAMIQVKRELDDGSSWAMWRTASRSCIMRVARVKAAGAPWPRMDWKKWSFAQANKQRGDFANKDKDSPVYRNTAFSEEVRRAAQMKLADLDDHYFGVKTGVAYVGFARQDEKQIIGQGGEWLCGSMRSDTIQAMGQLAKARMAVARADDIVIQTEIMMLMERKMSPVMALERFGAGQMPGVDGVALRDLTVLDKDKFYIPPLSIPFIDKDMRTLSQEFACIDDAEWRGFWERNWAEALGQAKALFLVQYGMQHANPNVQNYLLEFAVPPAEAFNNYVARTAGRQVRVVIRDVADALLVREVAWALFGPPGPCPQEEYRGVSAGDAAALATMLLPVLRYNFRSPDQALGNETGSTDEQFGPPGIQFLWNRFSGFYVGNKSTKNDECPPQRLAQALQLTSRWGIAHAAAYVRTVEKALGAEFGGIRWDEVYDDDHHPDRFSRIEQDQRLLQRQWDAYSKMDMSWEETAAQHIHSFLRSETGRAKICAYHNRGWVDAQPAFGIRLVDDKDNRLALQVVYCSAPGSGEILATRLTDPDGEIPFFDKTYEDYAFWIATGPLSKVTHAGRSRQVGDKIALKRVDTDGSISIVTQAAVVTAITNVAVALAVPAPGESVSGAAVSIRATPTAAPGQSIVAVRFLLAGAPLTAPVTDTYESTLDTRPLKNGSYALTAEAEDSAGMIVSSRAVTIKVENALPTVAITAPTRGPLVGEVVFVAEATAGAGMTMKKVQFTLAGSKHLGGEILPQAGMSTFSMTLRASDFMNGTARIVAIAEDMAGNTQPSGAVDMTVNAAPPTVAITAPSAGPVAGSFTLSADAQPGPGMTLRSVQFKIAGADHGVVPAPGPYTMEVDALHLKNGLLRVTAIATDTSGNQTTSAPVEITVKNPTPAITITSPVAGPVGPYIVLAADAQAGAGMTLKSVQFMMNEALIGRVLTAAPYVSDEIEPDPNEYTITAKAIDTAGNVVVSAPVVVEVQGP